MYNIYLILIAVSLLSLIINRRLISDIFPYFLVLLAVVLLVEGIGTLVSREMNDLIHYPYYMIELTIMGLVYQIKIGGVRNKIFIKTFIALSWLIFILMTIYYGLVRTQSVDAFLSHIFIVILAFIYFYEAFKVPYSDESLFKDPFFWINCANLFYYIGAFLMQTSKGGDYSLADQFTFYYISNVFNLSLYALYAFAFSCRRILG